MKMKRDMKHIK
ncbi:predicted protein [Fibroporia radiculosa]|uniref:Uncharacterized protein n=1 Tax=Fibroporia radiculosa TaxID=599839 RepID=J7S6P8_9APHY|nr:predicted protein [Fibroporia radiculosa]